MVARAKAALGRVVGSLSEGYGRSVWRWIPAVVTSGFVMAGFIKRTGSLLGVPLDLTVAFALLTALLVGLHLVVSGIPREAHGVVLAFTLLVPPMLWSATTDYGTDKVARLFTITFLAILAPVVLIRDTGDVARHLWALTGACGIVVASALLDPKLSSEYEGAPIRTDSANTIALGSAAGHVMVVLTLGLIWKGVPRLAVLAVAGAVYVSLQSGSRGPLLSALAAVLVGSLVTRVRPDYRRIAAFVALLLVGVVVAYQAAPYYAQQRILSVVEGGGDSSVDARVRLYQDALASISRHPFGIGWGSFEGITFGGYTYPHNLPLEVLAEAGLVLGGLFLAWMCFQILRAHRITVEYVGAAVFAIVIFWFGKSMASSDFNDNRVLLYVLGIAIAAGSVSAAGGRRSARSKRAPSLRASGPAAMARDGEVTSSPSPQVAVKARS
jgi:O-antigen ligase